MPLTKLQFKPGINREVTSYSNEGGWRDCDKVRFRFGYPEKIGGWEKYTTDTYVGSARALHNWIALDSSNYLGIGTHWKYYIEEGQNFEDITPIRATTAAGDVTFAATNGSTTVTITDTSHGAEQFDFVTFSGAVSLGGLVTAAVLNQEYQIQRVVDADTYEITVSVTPSRTGVATTTVSGTSTGSATFTGITQDSTSGSGTGAEFTVVSDGAGNYTVTVTKIGINYAATDTITILGTQLGGATTANDLTITVASIGGDTGNGGSACVGTYQINVGLDTTVGGTGWGAGTWSRGTWGSAAPGGITTTTELRIWSHDNFGEDLLICPRDSNIYYWDKTNGTNTRAVELSTVTGTKRSVPQVAKQVLVSDRDRHVIAFGADNVGANSSATQGDGVQDPLLIRFSDQESLIDWWPESTNTAGDLRLGAGSTFVQAVETKREILVWTDTALTSMRFIGPPFTFGLQQLASGITIMSPNAAIATEDFVFWMGIDNFYVYAGQTQQLPCSVKDKVFLDFNLAQKDKVVSAVNSEFSEVTWYYPSASSDDNDRYVTYNYGEKVWTFGSLARTAWLDRGTRGYPMAVGGGYLYNHELGYDDDGSAMTSFIESAAMDIGDGDRFAYIRKLIPDLTFDGSTNLSTPQATFTLKARQNPGAGFDNTGSGTSTRTQATPVEEYTEQLDVRVRGRSFALRVESSALGSKWKLGSPRIDIRQDGRR